MRTLQTLERTVGAKQGAVGAGVTLPQRGSGL